jgi:hypothetical protein
VSAGRLALRKTGELGASFESDGDGVASGDDLADCFEEAALDDVGVTAA